jgi:hypothetical protein
MKSIFTFMITTTLVLLSVQGLASGSPDYVRVRSINYAGSGCPAGTVAENISPDYKAFTLEFDSFIAETGPRQPLSASRKNCSIALSIDHPDGWQYTIFSVDYAGYISLDSGVQAMQKSLYYFQGQSATANLQTTFYGPTDRDYQIRDFLGITEQVWSPCGAKRALILNAQVIANNYRNPSGRGVITLDTIWAYARHRYSLQWRRC